MGSRRTGLPQCHRALVDHDGSVEKAAGLSNHAVIKNSFDWHSQKVAEVAGRCGVDNCELLVFLAQQILTLNDEQLTVMASGKSREDDT